MIQVDIVDDTGPERFDDPVLEVQRYAYIVFFGTECEGLETLEPI